MASAKTNLLLLKFLTLASLSILYVDKAISIRIPDRISSTPRELSDQSLKTAVFALGSFWRSEAIFGCLNGVVRTTAGYAGGSKINPEYRSLGDHAESVLVEYDPKEINFRQLLEIFWSSHDPRQKFELKRHPLLLHLIGNLLEDELERSTMAAKLSGYAAELCPPKSRLMQRSMKLLEKVGLF